MRVSNTAIGLVLIVFASAVLVYVRTFPSLDNGYPGPALFPSVLAVLFIICGIGLIIQGIRAGEKLLKFDIGTLTRKGIINILFVLAVILCYIYLSEYIGFLILSGVLLFVTPKWLGVSTLRSLILSVVVTLGIYLLFAKLLLVPLPWGLWGW
jgi:putative tricarboxylic transport membrane protein